eukprot:gene8638-34085_t
MTNQRLDDLIASASYCMDPKTAPAALPKRDIPDGVYKPMRDLDHFLHLAWHCLVQKDVASALKKGSGKEGDFSSQGGVRLTTLHGSKGLEFQVVFVVGCEDGRIPNLQSERKEELRLLYVGATRAEERLYLTWSTYSVLSPFVKAMLAQDEQQSIKYIDTTKQHHRDDLLLVDGKGLKSMATGPFKGNLSRSDRYPQPALPAQLAGQAPQPSGMVRGGGVPQNSAGPLGKGRAGAGIPALQVPLNGPRAEDDGGGSGSGRQSGSWDDDSGSLHSYAGSSNGGASSTGGPSHGDPSLAQVDELGPSHLAPSTAGSAVQRAPPSELPPGYMPVYVPGLDKAYLHVPLFREEEKEKKVLGRIKCFHLEVGGEGITGPMLVALSGPASKNWKRKIKVKGEQMAVQTEKSFEDWMNPQKTPI